MSSHFLVSQNPLVLELRFLEGFGGVGAEGHDDTLVRACILLGIYSTFDVRQLPVASNIHLSTLQARASRTLI